MAQSWEANMILDTSLLKTWSSFIVVWWTGTKVCEVICEHLIYTTK